MFNAIPENYRKPLFYAIGLHVLLLIALLIHFTRSATHYTVAQSSPVNIVKAVAVIEKPTAPPVPIKPITPPINTEQLQQNLARLQAAQQTELHEQQQHIVEQRVQLAQQKAEQMKLQQETQKLQEEKIAAQQAEQAHEAALLKQQAAAEKAAKIKQQQAAQLAAEAQKEALQKQKALAEAQKKQAEKAAKLATEQLMQQQLLAAAQQKQQQTAKLATQQLLQQQIAASEQIISSQQTTQASVNQGVIDKYKALIIQAIAQQWIIPDDAQKNLQGKLLVHLAPGGMVVSVKILQSSGDAVLDRSARTAVFKASPLPVPNDPVSFNSFRDLNLTFQPQGILASG